MSLISICQDVIAETGYGTPPVSIIGNSDALAVQLLALANKAGNEIAKQHTWSWMIRQSYIITVANTDTYLLNVPAIEAIIPESIYQGNGVEIYDDYGLPFALNQNRPVGSLTSKQFGILKNSGTLAPDTISFRVVSNRSSYGKSVVIIPMPTVSGIFYIYEYHSKMWVYRSSPSGEDSKFALDSDVVMGFPEELLALSLKWRIIKAKGFDYSEDYNEYQRALQLAIARDAPSETLNDTRCDHYRTAPNIPSYVVG